MIGVPFSLGLAAMRYLPALALGPTRCLLPMSDRTTAALAEAVLTESDASAGTVAALATHLAADPPAILWIVAAAALAGEQIVTVAEASHWISAYAVDLLQWADDAERLSPLSAEDCTRFADRVAADFQLADMAALLAAGNGHEAAEKAYATGLLHDARGWFCSEVSEAGEIPDDLAGIVRPRDSAFVSEAIEILAGRKPPASADLDPEACRRRARKVRRRWLRKIPGLAHSFPRLMVRLAGVRQLETRIHETLETEKLEAMAEFAAGAGHEINNPLAIIAGRAQLLLRDETDPERRHDLASINVQARRAHEMIADLRLFARPPRPAPRPTDLVDLADSVLAEMAAFAAERSIRLSRIGDPGPLAVNVDPVQLRVALHALCRNALEAIGREGQIEMAVCRRENDLEIRVSDNGPGISPEQRRHIFDPFYSARQAGRGLGMGLSKCWRIVTNHGGQIEVQDRPGGGTVFVVRIASDV